MKINKLLQAWPKGTVALHPWLQSQGISRKLAAQYRSRGWIDPIGHGAFIRRGDKVEWPGGVYALQKLGRRIHPGGRTALELHGLAHFLRLSGRPPVYLYGLPGVRLPTWFRSRDWRHPIKYSATGLFSRDRQSLTTRSFGDFSIEISSPERAVLEYLDGFPNDASFDEARELVEGLATPRPEVLQYLLEMCTSIKVKRMFLYLADQAKHPWRAKLKDKRITLGSGKRSLVSEGKFDPKYLITVPAEPSDSGA